MDRSILLVAFVGISCQSISIIPSFIKQCNRDDPHLDNCIKDSVEALKPFLRQGIPEFNIPPCDPLTIAQIKFDRGVGPVFVTSTYTNINVKGGTNFIVKDINVNMRKNDIELKISFPHLSMSANYNINGRILMLPISGDGRTNGNFSDSNAEIKIHGIRYKNIESNQTHFRIANFSVNVDIGHGQIYLDNLFNGNQELSDGMNQFLNENYEIISAELKPSLEIKISDTLKKIANEIFNKYPLDLLLPPSRVST